MTFFSRDLRDLNCISVCGSGWQPVAYQRESLKTSFTVLWLSRMPSLNVFSVRFEKLLVVGRKIGFKRSVKDLLSQNSLYSIRGVDQFCSPTAKNGSVGRDQLSLNSFHITHAKGIGKKRWAGFRICSLPAQHTN